MSDLRYDNRCTECKLHRDTDPEDVCVPGHGPKTAEIMVVSKNPSGKKYHDQLTRDLEKAGVDPTKVFYTSAIKCRNWDLDASNADVKACRQYLDHEIEVIKPKWILALGNEALLSSTGRSGITKYRGQLFERGGATVIPTISPSAVSRNPGQRPGYEADLKFFSNRAKGIDNKVTVPKYSIIDTKEKVKKLYSILQQTDLISYDVETTINPKSEFDPDARIITMAATCIVVDEEGKKRIFGFALPLYHPESPWRRSWKSVLKYLAPALEGIPKKIAHNGKFDSRWLLRFGVDMACTFDTLLAIHLLNENIQKGLKPNAQARLGVEPWGMSTKNLLADLLAQVLEYNFLDSYYTYLMYRQLVKELKEQPRLLRLFVRQMMPAARDLVHSEARGMWLDVERLNARKPECQAELDRIEGEIKKFLPHPDSEEWPKDARGRPLEVNFNASNFARWFLFEYLGLPILERGKDKPDGSPGNPSMAEDVLNHMKEEHPVVSLLLERVKWQKYMSGFFNAYEELYDENHRMHTSFKLFGTVTGRLSSGKENSDKVSGARGKVKGFNAQQVPRNPFIRGMFGAPPGWAFIEADYSQIELRVAAMLAKEQHMMHLYSIGADIHLATTSAVTGLPQDKIPKEVRKKIGKPVNFGYLYGMGWRKFIDTAFNNYGAVFSEAEARAFRDSYFNLYPDLLPWHERQRQLVAKFGRVESPIGRVRHLPDIYSPDKMVRAEAERQAINSPVQGFASDMAVFSMVLINQAIREKGLPAHCIGLVHDAINFECRKDAVPELLPLIKDTMEDPEPMLKKLGFRITIPIVADLKLGVRWGDATELTPDQVYDFKEWDLID